jgi:DNA-directed RNA polymerase sigma subunit (sigma70/sigma32)
VNCYMRERERACRMLEEEEGSTKRVIVRLRKEQPELTLATVAHMIGLSTERVRQILIAEGMPTKAIRPPKEGQNDGA